MHNDWHILWHVWSQAWQDQSTYFQLRPIPTQDGSTIMTWFDGGETDQHSIYCYLCERKILDGEEFEVLEDTGYLCTDCRLQADLRSLTTEQFAQKYLYKKETDNAPTA